MLFKDMCYLFISSSGSPFVPWTGTICAILVEGITRNNPVKLFEFVREMSLKERVYI